MLSSFGDQFGLDQGLALKVAGAFGGGMARMGQMCGAVTGAFMVIGLKYGMTRQQDEKAREKTYDLVREFVTRFKERHRFIVCKELLSYDVSNPEERRTASEKGLFDTLCPKLVGDAAEILEEIL